MKGLLLSTLFFAGSLGLPATNHVLHEKRTTPLPHLRRRVEESAIIPIRIALRQSNLHTGYDRLMDVSHPESPNYGKHLSAEEVHDIFAPDDETIKTVMAWLLDSGLTEDDITHYDNRGWLAIDVPASHGERLFNTEYYEYEHSGSHHLGCDEYSLPSHISQHVDFIKPGVKLSAPLKKRNVKRDDPAYPGQRWHVPHGPAHHWPHWQPPPGHYPPDLAACSVNITPTCIKALYGIPNAHLSSPVNVMGLYEAYDAYSQADLNLFFKHYAPNVPQGTGPKVNSVDGGTAPVAAGSVRNSGESDIDIDLGYALIYPQQITVYQIDDIPNASGQTGKAGFMNDFFDAVDGSYCNSTAFGITGNSPKIDPVYPDPRKGGYKGQLQCGKYELTRVVSISYGEAEIDLPKPYLQRSCQELMKLSLQGHSFFIASGDYGVASFPGDGDKFGCLDGETKKGVVYNPDAYSSCPYMTSVGATMLYPGQTIDDAESAMQVNLTAYHIAEGEAPLPKPYDYFASHGGFSNYQPRPAYQEAAVSNYLKTHTSLPYYVANKDASNIGENNGVYNHAGRAFPDVSANGAYLLAYNNLTLYHYFGTSLASPIFASVITLINEERTAAGKGPVGFVNPVLYEHPYVLNDVVNGSNPNCGSSGFQAAKGWDPVTGLGTPNYPAMLKLFMSLP